MNNNRKYVLPLAFIGMMFFTVGFATGINGYFVPFLENNLHLSSAQSYLVIAATFLAFLVFSFPASSIIAKIGYKRTMSLSFFLFAVAFALFIPAARMESFALYLAAREAARYTDAVCSGEGPDELFCGYPCYSRYFDAAGEDFWLKVNTVMDVGEIPELPRYGGDGFLKMNAFDLTRWLQGNILPNLTAAEKGAGIRICMR